MHTQSISILGSTGSIGESTLQVIAENNEKFTILAMSGYSNLSKLAKQTIQFQPKIVIVPKGKKADFLRHIPNYPLPIEIGEGEEGLIYISKHKAVDTVVMAIAGSAAIMPVMAAVQAGKKLALANKESIVLAGELIMQACKKSGAQILPIDSEHNAIFQCLQGNQSLESITLTASGGPFFKTNHNDFNTITLKQALTHPKWKMGKKITIDSATLVNKALEIIEAKWLFNLQPNQIKVVVHPQAVIHSFVSFVDGSSLAQLGQTDMRIPISYCLDYPKRILSGCQPLALEQLESLSFHHVDNTKFPTLNMAYHMLSLGGGCTAAFNGANETIVQAFLDEKIKFIDIFMLLQQSTNEIKKKQPSLPFLQSLQTIDMAIHANQWGAEHMTSLIDNL